MRYLKSLKKEVPADESGTISLLKKKLGEIVSSSGWGN